MPHLEPGQHAPLNVTQEANHRIFVGLGWDPNDGASVMDKARALVGGKKIYHDLDLSCFLYNAQGVLIGRVTAETGETIDESGRVYHSGDNEEGHGEGDDEQISVELKKLPAHIHHIVFAASIKSGHTFSEISSPEIHLVDGYSEHSFLHVDLGKEPGNDHSAFIFVRLYRDGEGWAIYNVSTFVDSTKDTQGAIEQHLAVTA